MSESIIKTFNERFDKFEESYQSLQISHNKLSDRMDIIDETTNNHETRIEALETQITKLQGEYTHLRAKVNGLESYSRRNNIKIVGIPEGEEKGKPTEFVTKLIPQLLGEANFQKPPLIDRAHRVQVRNPGSMKPHTLIARVHFYQDKELILRLRLKRALDYNGHRIILIYSDYTAEVMEQRSEFRGVIQTLRELKVKYSLRYPARLYIQHDD